MNRPVLLAVAFDLSVSPYRGMLTDPLSSKVRRAVDMLERFNMKGSLCHSISPQVEQEVTGYYRTEDLPEMLQALAALGFNLEQEQVPPFVDESGMERPVLIATYAPFVPKAL